MSKWFIVIVFFLGCLVLMLAIKPKPHKSEKRLQLARALMMEFSQTLEQELGVELVATGYTGRRVIKELDLHFVANDRVDVAGARKHFIEIAERFIEAMNNDRQLRPYLDWYPANHNSISLIIRFHPPDGQSLETNHVRSMHIARQQLFYYRPDPETGYNKDFYSEPYEEALRIVRQDSP